MDCVKLLKSSAQIEKIIANKKLHVVQSDINIGVYILVLRRGLSSFNSSGYNEKTFYGDEQILRLKKFRQILRRML